MSSNKHQILIIGPFSEFGGRESEAAYISNALIQVGCSCHILSTIYSEHLEAIQSISPKTKVSSLYEEVYEQNLLVRWITRLVFSLKRKKKKPIWKHSHNQLVLGLFDMPKLRQKAISKAISHADLVLLLASHYTLHLDIIIELSRKQNKPLLFRNTAQMANLNQETYERNLLGQVSAFILHGKKTSSYLESFGNHRVFYIDQFANNEKQLLNLETPKNVKTFAAIGRLEKEKNLDLLIRAFQKLSGDFELRIIGSGSESAYLKELAKNDPRIVFIDYVPNQKMPEMYDQIDCLVICSQFESGPLTGIEAMAAGRLIISGRLGAMEQRLEGLPNSFWLEDISEDSLLTQMQLASQLPTQVATSWSENVRKRYLQDYSQKQIDKKYQELILGILSEQK